MKILFESYKVSGKYYTSHEIDVFVEYKQFDSAYDFWSYKTRDIGKNPNNYSGLADDAYKQYGCVVSLIDSDNEKIFSFMIFPSWENWNGN